jgi:hypothetical protein
MPSLPTSSPATRCTSTTRRCRCLAAHLAPLKRKKRFVYAKPPFSGSEEVLAYLARYTPRRHHEQPAHCS